VNSANLKVLPVWIISTKKKLARIDELISPPENVESPKQIISLIRTPVTFQAIFQASLLPGITDILVTCYWMDV
jgi:hypothetical protein